MFADNATRSLVYQHKIKSLLCQDVSDNRISKHQQKKMLEVTNHTTTRCWTRKSTSALPKLLAWWSNRARMFWTLNTRYTRYVSSIPCCIAVTPGWLTPYRRIAWKNFSFATYNKSTSQRNSHQCHCTGGNWYPEHASPPASIAIATRTCTANEGWLDTKTLM